MLNTDIPTIPLVHYNWIGFPLLLFLYSFEGIAPLFWSDHDIEDSTVISRHSNALVCFSVELVLRWRIPDFKNKVVTPAQPSPHHRPWYRAVSHRSGNYSVKGLIFWLIAPHFYTRDHEYGGRCYLAQLSLASSRKIQEGWSLVPSDPVEEEPFLWFSLTCLVVA